MVAISIWQAGNEMTGLGFAAGLGATVLVLLLVAWVVTRVARKLLPRSARFTFRQGIANLYRPHNQTLSITLSLGFGVFVIATMLCVQSNLLSWLNIEGRANAPNVLAFDIQEDEKSSVATILAQHRVRAASFTPIVPARIKAINGTSIDSLASHARELDIEPWTLRREYRNTYRDTVVESEKVISGRWFSTGRGMEAGIAPISVEQGVAGDLHLKLGDRVTWDFQGVSVDSRVTSLRKVDWAQFSTNFFVVFPTGIIENAPHTFVALGRLESATGRAALQRDLVAANPNVSVIDLATVRAALDEILGKIMLAVRFMAIFSIGAGVIVLIGGVATSRFQRLRESALLKALGATRRQIVEVLVTEYAALGIMGGATGVLLGGVASWLLMKYFFKLDYHAPALALLITWLGVVLLAVVVGVFNSRDVWRRSPLVALREEQ
jgi:putative ABC transport system permease protein